jgi:hypothetical protein
MDFDAYKRINAINASAIKKGAQSMLKMRIAMEGKDSADTPSMRFGRICHAAMLEPLRFAQTLQVFSGSKRSKEYAALMASCTDADCVLTADELQKVSAMQEIFRANKDAQDLMKDIAPEFVLQWESDTYGKAKARADGIKRNCILEYKTTKDASERAFFNQCSKLGYDIGAGWYMHGAKQCGVVSSPDYVFIVQETSEPYEIAVYDAPKQMIEIGYAKAEEIAKRYRQCEQTGIWTGIQPEGRRELILPDWYAGGAELVFDMESNDMEGDE